MHGNGVGPLGLAGFESTIASVAYPDRFSSLSNAYVITPSISIDQKEFFHYPNYTQSALDLFTTDKSEYSIGQLRGFRSTRGVGTSKLKIDIKRDHSFSAHAA